MSSIFERIATLTKAAIHEGLNKLEDPVLLTGQYLRNLEDEIHAAETKQRELTAAAKVLERREQEYRILAEHSETEAVNALGAGNEAAAKTAVLAKLRYQDSLQECQNGLAETRATLAQLEVNLQHAKEEHVRLKAKRAELVERARTVAERPHHTQASYTSPSGTVLNPGAAARGFERMEDKITEWEAYTEGTGYAAPSQPAASANPAVSSAVEAELERLRQKRSE